MKHKRSIMSIAMAAIMLVSLCAVLSSPSVMTVDGSSANVQPSTALVGAPVVGAPGVCAQDANSLELFAQRADHALLWKHWQSGAGWSSWVNLGGYLTSSPAAASRRAGDILVYARGSDGALYERGTVDGGAFWSPWYKIGGQLLAGTGPATYAYNEGIENYRHGVFVTGTNHSLYHIWPQFGSWSAWGCLGGYLTSSPAATAQSYTVIIVCGRGSDGALWMRYTDNAWGSWSLWAKIGGQLLAGTSPAVYDWGQDRVGFFATGTTHALYHTWTGHSGWENLGGYLTSSPAATARANGLIDVFVRGTNGELYQKTYSNNAWGSWGSIGGI